MKFDDHGHGCHRCATCKGRGYELDHADDGGGGAMPSCDDCAGSGCATCRVEHVLLTAEQWLAEQSAWAEQREREQREAREELGELREALAS